MGDVGGEAGRFVVVAEGEGDALRKNAEGVHGGRLSDGGRGKEFVESSVASGYEQTVV